jgi:hypothetical protein
MMTPVQRALAAAFVAAVALVGALHAHSTNPRGTSHNASNQLREVVTHRICYVDVNDKKICE